MPKKLHIGVQAWFLPQPFTGIGQHTLGLVNALAEHENVELTVVTPKAIRGLPKNVKVQVLAPKKWLRPRALQKWFWERVQVPRFFVQKTMDWEYYPYPCPLPKRSTHRRAMTVHDCIPWIDVRYQGGRIKTHYYREARRSLVFMDQIFAVSEATKKELGLPAVILSNAAPAMPKTWKKKKNAEALIYLGGYDLRKRVPLLLKRFEEARRAFPSLELWMIGEPHHRSRYYPELPACEGVRFLGKLSDEELYQTLYGSLALVHASDSEGFNIPLLQAMWAGTPAVVSDLPVHHEISKEAAFFWNPSKAGALCDTIPMLHHAKKRKECIEKQKKVGQLYSWKKSAHVFLTTLQNVHKPAQKN